MLVSAQKIGHNGLLIEGERRGQDMISFDTALQAMSSKTYSDEKTQVKDCLTQLHKNNYDENKIRDRVRELIEKTRLQPVGYGIETFFQEYGISTAEGIAIMRLAEALIRIPDSKTANEFIHDALKDTQFRSHAGLGKSTLINASALGMQLATRLFSLGKVIQMLSDPIVRIAIKQTIAYMSDEFVFAETAEKALLRTRPWTKKQYTFSFDMLGEGAKTEQQAEHYLQRYLTLLDHLADTDAGQFGMSVKLTALTPHLSWHKKEQLEQELLPKLKQIVQKAARHRISITIDAEETHRHDITRWLFAILFAENDNTQYEQLGLAVQAYQVNALQTLKFLKELAQTHKRKIPIRLVKGAYWDQEIKLAQEAGLASYPIYTHKPFTDVSFLACADYILQHTDYLYGQFGTHNAQTIAAIEHLMRHYQIDKTQMEFQLLYGMGFGIYHTLAPHYTCRIYAPVGKHKELLPYLIRRLIENGAGNSFVNQLTNKEITIEKLVEDPLTRTHALLEASDDSLICLPQDIFPNRFNSKGIDLGNMDQVAKWQKQVGVFAHKEYEARSLVTIDKVRTDRTYEVVSPHNIKRHVGKVHLLDPQYLDAVVASASAYQMSWQNMALEKRCQIIERISGLFEQHQYELVSLLQKEAGKTIHDAVAEVREAVDFCRYYAIHTRQLMKPTILPSVTGERNSLALHPKGVFVCISPWNFPLAIFTGQIVAALVTGNIVIAKPARTTSLIAYRAVNLMYDAGVPQHALQLLFTTGKAIDEVVLKNEAISGVCFTGSFQSAKHIEQTLAARSGRIATFIAETGGLNAMIVDSSVLIERTVGDIIQSAFISAGQRCSACRVLYVQEDIADELLTMLSGAMQTLIMGNPETFSTDIGPVISTDAKESLSRHIQDMKKRYTLISKTSMHAHVYGHFVSPHLFEVSHIDDIEGEHFGPVLHVIRYHAKQLDEIIEQINQTGFGLTLGIQTRLQDKIEYISKKAKVGNIYVNRAMTGAVVGSQPFGGEGLSGTGFKAGGPYYLLRFLNERVISNNKTVIGGDMDLYAFQANV